MKKCGKIMVLSEKIEFNQFYLILLGKEYLISSLEDERRVYKKAEMIQKTTGIKPSVVASFRNV